ncbi:MAG: hypothetical protein HYV27_07895 [Candidatus Hydrogenedentes bacterium]|nr:hypothetical protein [Candidatus Hydrogenedentota bacterium]
MRSFTPSLPFVCCMAALLAAPLAHAGRPENIEKGRDVGDGQVRYDCPFDPAAVPEVTFVAPTAAYPFYEIAVPLGAVEGLTDATVTKAAFNGVACDSFYVFVDGFSHVQSGWITRKATKAENVLLVMRSLWHNGEKAAIEVTISGKDAAGAAQSAVRHVTATAPGTGGGPEGFRRYQTVVLEETAGVAREAEPFECSIAARKEDAADLATELRVFALNEDQNAPVAVPFQSFNAQRFDGTPAGTSNENYLQHPSQSIDLVFLASVPADGAQVYLFAYDHPNVPAAETMATDLVVDGPDLGAMVENRFFKADLDDKSGQIASFQLKGRDENPVPLLSNHLSNAAHWNPDSFSDNGLWGHTFAWDPPDRTVVSTRGPILFRITNSGRMPAATPQVYASVTYSFYASVPYVKVSTVLEVRDPLNVNALRNGELVLDAHLVTDFVWEDKDGGLRTARGLHGPNWQDEWATRLDHDVPWLALTNEPGNFGIAELVQTSTAFNPVSGEATVHRPAFYLYYHHFWGSPVTYFTRAWIYPFSDYQRGPIVKAAVGSTYVEKMAFMPFFLRYGADRYGDVQSVSKQLKMPLRERWGR